MGVPQTGCWCGREMAAGWGWGWEGPTPAWGLWVGTCASLGGVGERENRRCPRVLRWLTERSHHTPHVDPLPADTRSRAGRRGLLLVRVPCPNMHCSSCLQVWLWGSCPPRAPLPDLPRSARPPLGDALRTSGSERRAKLGFSWKQSMARGGVPGGEGCQLHVPFLSRDHNSCQVAQG